MKLEYNLKYDIVGKKFLKQVLGSYCSFDAYVNLIELLYGEYVAKEFVNNYEGSKKIFWTGENEKLINGDRLFPTILFQMFERNGIEKMDVRNDEGFWKKLCLYFGIGRRSDDGSGDVLVDDKGGYKSFDNGLYWFVCKDVNWSEFVKVMRNEC